MLKSHLTRRAVIAGLAGASVLGRVPFGFSEPSTAADPIASTQYGKVRGIAAKRVLSFRGIPYGGPADGANRFMPPTMPMPWKDVRDASEAGPRAIQVGEESIFASPLIGDYFSGGRKDALAITRETNSENCLVLNVLTPALEGHRPVMVYIHGGGVDELSGALTLLSDRFVAEEDVVVVGINHRLNVLGYTYLGGIDPAYAESGNVGQLDLIAALKWLRDNIANFGGDPSNVTLFGESGGGIKINALLAMPAAKGLFRRAIVESGSFLKFRTAEGAAEDTRKLLAGLGLDASPMRELLKLPPEKLLSAYGTATHGLGGPVIDGRSILNQGWQFGAPAEAAGVSMIIGCCKDETTLFSLDDKALYSLDWQGLRSHEIAAGIPKDRVDTVLHTYRTDYPNDTASDLYFRMATDKGLRSKAIEQAQVKRRQGGADVYMYYFAWNTGLGDGRLRAFHTAELPLAMRLVANPVAEELSRQIAGAWAAFARTGNPSHSGLPPWEPYSLETRSTMLFDVGQTALTSDPAKKELALLRSVPKGYPYKDD